LIVLRHTAHDAEVANLHVLSLLTVVVGAPHNQDVRRFHIAVNDAVRVGMGEAGAYFTYDAGGTLNRQGAAAREHVAKFDALEALHREPERSVRLFSKVQNAHKVRVVEHARRSSFGVESCSNAAFQLQRGPQHFYCDREREMQVTSAVHDTERAVANARFEP
jgi:hypothetical protein